MELITYNITQPRERYPGRKGVYPAIVGYDKGFRNLSDTPIMADELDLSTEAGQTLFNELVYSKYEGDVFTNVPKCPCGHTHGGENEGNRCLRCGYLCQTPTEQSIQPLVWIRAPKLVGHFLNPHAYQLLKEKLTTQSFSVLDWLIDPKYRAPRLQSIQEDMLLKSGLSRGMSYFYDNLDHVFDTIFELKEVIYRGSRRETVRLIGVKVQRELRPWIEETRSNMFSEVLPFPSKIGFIIENVGNMKYVDPEMRPALNALISIAKSTSECKTRADAESRVARATRDLAEYYKLNEEQKIFPKEGIFRKLVYGTTPHFTFRSVITSEHLPHDCNVIKIPWGSAMMLFKLHIGNKVLKEGYTPNQWLSLIYDNIQRAHPKLNMIFDELIAESTSGKGPACLFTRFPSLKHNSSSRFYIQVKRDPRHMSTSLSLLTVKNKNADFDGDSKTLLH